jgi:hypothetical protein
LNSHMPVPFQASQLTDLSIAYKLTKD